MISNILVPLDGSQQAEQALEYAIEEFPDAELTLLHVLDIGDAGVSIGIAVDLHDRVREASRERASAIFEDAREVAASAGYEGELDTIVEEGRPSRAIVRHAADFDQIVMGSHGREGPAQILLGSVTETVVRRSPVPVVVVR